MRFLIDANMPRSIIALVASLGHEVEFARDVGLAAAPDHEIAERAQATGAALLTRDLDFADVRRNCGTGSRALPACTGLSRAREFGKKGQLKLTPNSHPAAVETHTQQGYQSEKI